MNIEHETTSRLLLMLADRGARERAWTEDRIDRIMRPAEYTDTVDDALTGDVASELARRIDEPRRSAS